MLTTLALFPRLKFSFGLFVPEVSDGTAALAPLFQSHAQSMSGRRRADNSPRANDKLA